MSMERAEDNGRHPYQKMDTRDPFQKALQALMPRQPISPDVSNFVRGMMSKWGGISSSVEQYRQTVAGQRQSYSSMYSKDMHNVINTSSVVSKRGGSTTTMGTSWNQELNKIAFSELVLFQTAKGSYIEGKIVGEAIKPIVGGTVLIQEEETRKTMLICFYNLLPDGISGADADPYLKEEFPMGATLRIAEPFSKIFNDGQRGVRVDTPSELHVVRGSASAAGDPDTSQSSASSLTEAKAAGNQFVKDERYLAATDSYLKGLRANDEAEFVATLLSNRSQAHLLLHDWGQALCDAAASLTIRPTNEKTWARYKKCLDHLLTNRGATKQNLLGELLCDIPVEHATSKATDMIQAKKLKETGNTMYKTQDYEAAIENYSKALQTCGETTRAILSNWAFCSLKIRNFGDIIAATTASLRIGMNEKALFRLLQVLSFLGEYDIALKGLDEFDFQMQKTASASSFSELEKDLHRCIDYREAMVTGRARRKDDVRELIENTPTCIGNWINPLVEIVTTKSNVSGLRAKADLPSGSAILVEWPLVSEELQLDDTKKKSLLVSTYDRDSIRMGSSAMLRPAVMNRLRRETVLGKILSKLPNGKRATATTEERTAISDLLVNLDMFPFLLPTHREYAGDEPVIEMPSDEVEIVLNLNCHGKYSRIKEGTNKEEEDETSLFPLVSMMKHSSSPNCSYAPNSLKFLLTLLTIRDVKAGEELTIMYHANNQFVARNL